MKSAASTTTESAKSVENGDADVPGGLPDGLASAIPSWYTVGWRQMSGIDKPPLTEGEEKDKGILDAFLAEQFYGSWYHNAALIVFVSALSQT